MKAYVHSLRSGIVQIGDTFFLVSSNSKEKVWRGRKKEAIAIVDVKGKSMEWAKRALEDITGEFERWRGVNSLTGGGEPDNH